ncbi:MAG: ABC transporter substrate-binding protein [Actinobacteria bacterium]|nr:ABC transporter substrate-binding protein [Actinomycetota bacterium]
MRAADRGPRLRTVVALLLLAATVAACGSRRTEEELRAALVVEAIASPAPGTATAPGPSSASDEADDEGSASSPAPGATGGATTTGPDVPRSVDESSATDPSGASGGPDPAASEADPRPGDAAPPPPAEEKPPLIIGSVGPLTGLVGATLKPGVDGLRAWVAHINSKGGLNGHPVELIAVDDQADPARHRTLVQELVDERGVVAFVQNGEAVSGEGSISFHQERRIPVIGSEGGAHYFYEHSMYFPQMSSGRHLSLMNLGSAATYAEANGLTKYGTLVCQEAQVCADSLALAREYADDLGLEMVYGAQASLAKPDFTAECLNARDAGAEILNLGMDRNSFTRVAAACARQGFFPVYTVAASIGSRTHLEDENIATFVMGAPVAPFPLASHPAVAEFNEAFARFAPGEDPTVGHVTGWVSGKLLEAAAHDLAEPTTAAVLEGLWRIRGDDLDGMTHPLTFTRDGTAEPSTCWWPVVAQDGRYSVPFGPAIRCTDLL